MPNTKKTETVPGTERTGTDITKTTPSKRGAKKTAAQTEPKKAASTSARPAKRGASKAPAKTTASPRAKKTVAVTPDPVVEAPIPAEVPTLAEPVTPPVQAAPKRGARKAAPAPAPVESTPTEAALTEAAPVAAVPADVTAEVEATPAPASEPQPVKARRGRPAKVKTEHAEQPEIQERAAVTAAADTETVNTVEPTQPAEAIPAEQPKPARGKTGRRPSGAGIASLAEIEPAPVTATEGSEEPTAPKRKAGRGRQAAAPVTEPEVQAPTAELAPEPGAPAVKPARRGRKPRAAPMQDTPASEPEGVADALPDLAPTDADPVILEVPRKRGGRRKNVLPVAPLEDVLTGVEAVTSEPQPTEVAAEAVETEPVTAEHLVTEAPAAETKGRRGRKKKPEAAPAPTPVDADEPTPVVDQAAESVEEAEAGEPLPGLDPLRDLVVAQLRKLGRPVHVRDLERTFTRQTMNRLGGWRELTDLLDTLVEDGQVIRTRKKTYGLPEAMSLIRGRFQASAAGFGFVIPDSGGEDYYVPAEQTLEAWNGDIVLVRQEGRGDSRDDRGRGGSRRGQRGDGNPRASVVRIVQRAYRQLVGTLEFHHGHPILKPDDHRARHRILLLPEGLDGLEAGARVVTELFWPEHTGEDEVFGQVSRVLGDQDDPVTETEAVIVKFGLRGDFPEDVLEQANAIPTQIPEEALKGRLDLRDFNIFTVDGRDAKDFDDAIHIQPTPEGTFVVGVHIADVSHYVQEGSPLDEEAYARATSVYLPGRVLPMLPEHLSNGVCSLVPYEDRLTMTALVELSAEGEILKVQLAPSVINSKARLTYDEVQAYSEATATLPEHARHLEGDLHLLLKITTKLRQKRLREGSLDFKLREVKVDVGPDGRMELIPIREETARGMIEDLMLLANKVVAHELIQREIPALFRIHEEPTLQRFQDVTNAIGRLGLAFPGGEPTPQAYQAVLKQVRGTPRESVVNTLLLRSMQQAKYAGENLGHFGLAFDEYLHFTSPIRRYPDLLVHRVLRGMLSGELKASSRGVAQLQARLPGMGEHTSERERAATEAERDLTKYYQAKWAQEHLGESFPGTVSGVVASGLFVALDNGVEGKLHISHLDDDYYVFIEDAQILRGRSRGRSYRLGDSLHVTIQAVNPLARQTDFTLADPTDPDYRPGDLHQETDMDSPVKPRARRREDREQEKREKLQSLPVSEPKKFTLEDPSNRPTLSPSAGGRGGRGRQAPAGRSEGRGESRGEARGEGRERGQGRTFGGVSMGRSRRVITLERPRNEHLRPVNITVQRMYFGDWTLENMPPEDGQGGGRGGRPPMRERSGGERGRGFTRGGNDRGAVQRVNGRQQGQGQGRQREAAPQVQAPQPAPAAAQDAAGDDAKRRRRRRGRRGGGGSAPTQS
ncbi:MULTISPECIES: ribonuclease R [unclassified Deinococcus]|uniref:ribonuclease R n=1 Tax=unclassified Deinococcus TaxID=2623546 RepID=UPI001C308495|nr:MULTISPECIES: ribonuclease R [unclassified Deinococcus]MDK2011074.1 ribonuclease R [Deinococcus sp. 43]